MPAQLVGGPCSLVGIGDAPLDIVAVRLKRNTVQACCKKLDRGSRWMREGTPAEPSAFTMATKSAK